MAGRRAAMAHNSASPHRVVMVWKRFNSRVHYIHELATEKGRWVSTARITSTFMLKKKARA